MAEPSKTVATGYGETDIEAKAMTGAAQGDAAQGGAAAKAKAPGDKPTSAPSPDTFVPAAGTTDADIGKNLRAKADRESKS